MVWCEQKRSGDNCTLSQGSVLGSHMDNWETPSEELEPVTVPTINVSAPGFKAACPLQPSHSVFSFLSRRTIS